MLEQIYVYDRNLLITLNNLGIEKYDVIWITITEIVTWIPLGVLLLILIFKNYSRKEAISLLLIILIAVVFVLLLTEGVKEYVGRLRPNNDPSVNQFIRILKTPDNFSFFSGHASTSFTLTMLIVLFLRKKFKWIYFLFFWPIIFSLSRLYVGVHYPADIMVGSFVGVLMGILFYEIHKIRVKKLKII